MLKERINKKMTENLKDFINQKLNNIYYEIKSYSNDNIEVHLYNKNYFDNDFILNLIKDEIIVFKREDKTFFISTKDTEIYMIIE
jgi:hypothetical protein